MTLFCTKTLEGDQFFQFDEAIEILCASSPLPLLIATLLRLSKKVRRDVWDFLIDPHKCNEAWYHTFCEQLWHYRESCPKDNIPICSLHPLFVIPGQKFVENRYHIAKVLEARNSTLDVLIGAFYWYFPDPILLHPGWEMASKVDANNVFEWYFVACALAMRLDRMIMINALERWKEVPIIPHDTTLYIAYK